MTRSDTTSAARVRGGMSSAGSGDAGIPASDARPFAWPVRVYWEDTDAGGVVYHAAYLRFFERARTEWLRAAGIEQRQLHAERGLVFVVHRMDLTFRRPARLDDLLAATVAPVQLRGASLHIAQTLLREADPAPLAEAQVRVACLEADTFRPRAIPDDLLREITKR
jgi:acyl-CoA thioester hydrolase